MRMIIATMARVSVGAAVVERRLVQRRHVDLLRVCSAAC